MNNKLKLTDIDMKTLLKNLRKTMERELAVMRELLANLQEEQQAILANQTDVITKALKERESLMETIYDCRKYRCEATRQLAEASASSDLQADLTNATLDILHNNEDPDSCTILSVRQSLLAILENIERQTVRNNYLIQNKISLTKEMIRRLYPVGDNTTYGKDGTVGNKRRCAVAIINREV